MSTTGASSLQRVALTALVVGGAAIGGSPIFMRLSEVGPLATAFWRVALALIPISVLWRLRKNTELRPQGAFDIGWLVLPGIVLSADLAAWHLSITMTTIANATLLANLAPIFVALLGFAFFRAVVSRTFVIGLVLALAGLAILSGPSSSLSNGDLRGDAVAILSAVLYAGYILAISSLRSRYNTICIMFWSTASAAIAILPLAFFLEPMMLPSTISGWALILGLSLISHASGQLAITYALAYLPAALSSLTLLLQPVVATVLAWVLLDEAIKTTQAIAGLVMLMGVVIARRG